MRTTGRVTTALLLLGAILAGTPAGAHAQKRQRDVITRDEILASAQSTGNLYDAVRALRPHFLEPPRGIRTLGNSVAPPTLVVVDGNRQPGLDNLQTIMAVNVQEVRWLEPSRAENEYGAAGGSGAVVVRMYKPKKVTKDSVPPSPA